jgi:hypothetical protein
MLTSGGGIFPSHGIRIHLGICVPPTRKLQFEDGIHAEELQKLADTYLGKNILITNREEWDDSRSTNQIDIEAVPPPSGAPAC